MKSETVDALLARIRTIEAEAAILRSTVEGETLAMSERQYLARCFDLLHIELEALRSFISGLQ